MLKFYGSLRVEKKLGSYNFFVLELSVELRKFIGNDLGLLNEWIKEVENNGGKFEDSFVNF